MKQEQLMEVFVLAKRMGNLLDEVNAVSVQLAEAVDRRDEVSMEMVVAMRFEPVEKLSATDRALRTILDGLGESDEGKRMRALLNGDASAAENETEKALAQQAASNLRLHARVMEQDRILNRKIGRDKSIYQ